MWVYEEPSPEVSRIRGLVCFFNERVDLQLDGVLEQAAGSSSLSLRQILDAASQTGSRPR